jgi:molybdopterin converting factor small subunit
MALVLIPPALQWLTGGLARVEADGPTLDACITALDRRFPGLRERLVDGEGELHPHIAIYVNGEDVRTFQDLATPTRSTDEVTIVPAIAGG